MLEIVVPVASAVVAVASIALVARRWRERVARWVRTMVLVACFIEGFLMGTLPTSSLGQLAWHVVIAMCWGVIAGGAASAVARLSRDTNDPGVRIWRHVEAHRRSARRRLGVRPITRAADKAATNTKGDI